MLCLLKPHPAIRFCACRLNSIHQTLHINAAQWKFQHLEFWVHVVYGYSKSKIPSVRYSWILCNDGSMVKYCRHGRTWARILRTQVNFVTPVFLRWDVGMGEFREAHKPASLLSIAANIKTLPQTRWKTGRRSPRLSSGCTLSNVTCSRLHTHAHTHTHHTCIYIHHTLKRFF